MHFKYTLPHSFLNIQMCKYLDIKILYIYILKLKIIIFNNIEYNHYMLVWDITPHA